MAEPARTLQEFSEKPVLPSAPVRRTAPPLAILLNAHQLATAKENLAAGGGEIHSAHLAKLRYVDVPAAAAKNDKRAARKETGVLRGIKDLQQLQKQTLAVLESVKANLEDISQVLRSPEATRGLEKQQNAATLLSKGFARDAVEQATGAVGLLPANPEAHLLLSLSLAADQQFENSLTAARKGLALFDRRNHPLAIEAGLLHALAALGCGAEAVERWATIIDALPVPVLLEHLGRVTACFPTDAPEGHLDELVTRRLTREVTGSTKIGSRGRSRIVETKPGEIPAGALFAGLEAAHRGKLVDAHRAILGQVARRLTDAKDATEILRFIGECVVPLGNIGLDRSASALGRATVKRLLGFQADAMTLYRALQKLEMAGAEAGTRELAMLLDHWRREGAKMARARHLLLASASLLVGGTAGIGYEWWVGSSGGGIVWMSAGGVVVGAVLALFAVMSRTWTVELPHDRPGLSAEELQFIGTASVKQSLRGILTARRR